MTVPDTIEVVRTAVEKVPLNYVYEASDIGLIRPDSDNAVQAAIDADRKELADQGYEIVKRGTAPSWMQPVQAIGANFLPDGPLPVFYQLVDES